MQEGCKNNIKGHLEEGTARCLLWTLWLDTIVDTQKSQN
jgi:hypothetical protein